MEHLIKLCLIIRIKIRSQWPRGPRFRSVAARLLGLFVRIPLGAWMSVYFECYVLSGRGVCDELITLPGESYLVWRVVECNLTYLPHGAESFLRS